MDIETLNGDWARQGDVLIVRLPAGIKVNTTSQTISPRDGKLILLEGEMTGHHHCIDTLERPQGNGASPRKTSKLLEGMLAKAALAKASSATLYRDLDVPKALVEKKWLERTDMFIGALVVEGDMGVVVEHQEHPGVRLLKGNYYVGRQVESAGAETRAVQD